MMMRTPMADANTRGIPPSSTTLTGPAPGGGDEFETMEATVAELVASRAREHGSITAVTGASGSLTFAELESGARRLAAALADGGCRPGDRIAVHCDNAHAAEFFLSFAAVGVLGGVFVPLNCRAAAIELGRIMVSSEPSALITIADDADTLAKLRDSMHAPAMVVRVAEVPRLIAAHQPVAPATSELNDDAAILYTSGTTGLPKGAVCTQAAFAQMGERTVASLLGPEAGWPPVQPGDGMQIPVPLYTSTGVIHVISATLHAGMSTWIDARFDAAESLARAEAFGPSVVMAVPSMMALMAEVASPGSLRSVRTFVTGGAHSSPDLLARARSLWPHTGVINCYSLTESGGAMVTNSGDLLDVYPGAAGIPVRGTTIRIESRSGDDAPADGSGFVQFRGPGMCYRYFRNPEETARTFRSDGWLVSGDIGRIDGGLLRLVGRAADMIIRGGFNIMPREIEAALETHPAVLEAAVFAKRHRVLGEDIVAVVVPRHSTAAHGLSIDQLRAHCGETLADYKVPRDIRVVTEPLPRNAFGKVMRRDLAERLGQG